MIPLNSLKGRKLKPEIKERWLANLPKYPRTKGHLRDDKGFCCLAVLGDLAVADGLAIWKRQSLTVPSADTTERYLFPGCLLEWAFENVSGLDKKASWDFDYEVDHDSNEHSLSTDNDCGESIESICQTIKTYF